MLVSWCIITCVGQLVHNDSSVGLLNLIDESDVSVILDLKLFSSTFVVFCYVDCL